MNELSEKLIILYSTPDGVVGAVVSKMETAAGRTLEWGNQGKINHE